MKSESEEGREREEVGRGEFGGEAVSSSSEESRVTLPPAGAENKTTTDQKKTTHKHTHFLLENNALKHNVADAITSAGNC